MPFEQRAAASAERDVRSIPSPATTAATGSWRPIPSHHGTVALRRNLSHRVAGEQLDAPRAVRIVTKRDSSGRTPARDALVGKTITGTRDQGQRRRDLGADEPAPDTAMRRPGEATAQALVVGEVRK